MLLRQRVQSHSGELVFVRANPGADRGPARSQVTPRGVQLHLGDVSRPHVSDTLVMSNLGYFQLKSAPGVWSLSLAPGATSALYTIHSSSGISEGGRVQTADASAATMVVVSRSGQARHCLARDEFCQLYRGVRCALLCARLTDRTLVAPA